VIVLAAIVLLSVIVLVFYVQTSLNRQIAFSSGAQYRAEMVARSALDTIVGDLLTEIAEGSTVETTNSIRIAIPKTNFTTLPTRVADQGFPNLVKISAGGSNAWSGTNYSIPGPIRSATSNSTTNTSANGRHVPASRWNANFLFGATLPAGFTAPDWVPVTREGAATNAAALPAPSILADSSTNNAQYVVGRFAYAIFDEGGLMDVTVAGYPTGVDPDFTARRGLLPQVDLGKIPGVLDANALIKWRNAVSAASAEAYTNYALSNTNGFRAVASGDQTFISRKDLIAYAQTHPDQLQLSALQYLGTFSRSLNAPSYTPDPNRPKVSDPSLITYGHDDDYNPSLVNLRRPDGQPLLQKRFPLSRLALITQSATANASSDIYKYFGLQRSSASDPWVYNHGAANRILRLSQIADLDREPDFLELLQAAISVGSLGKSAKNSQTGITDPNHPGGSTDVETFDQNTSYQIVQIAANILDQYDTDSFPSRITFDSEDFAGLENLPYLTRVFGTPYRFSLPSTSPNIGIWYQPEIWNPHAQAQTPSSDGPSQFRFIATGEAYAEFFDDPRTHPLTYTPSIVDSIHVTYPSPTANSGGIRFSASSSASFEEPTLLTPANATASREDDVTDGSTRFLGIHVGTASAPDKRLGSGQYEYWWATALSSPAVTFHLQYQDNQGNWITYHRMREVTSVGATRNNSEDFFRSARPLVFETRSDPRSDRFGAVITTTQPAYNTNASLRPDANLGAYAFGGVTPSPGWTYGGSQLSAGYTFAYLGTLSDNKSSSETHYTDPDGVSRRADGAYTTGSMPHGYPLAPGNFPSRPIILNRPFRSAADLAYASRDLPWKSLDFFTAESGDAALPDIFCLNESPDPAIEAGKLNLNTRQQPVLASILSGAIKSELTDTAISDTEASTLAASLINRTSSAASGQGPLLNRSDLVTQWTPDLSLLSYDSAADSILKSHLEAAIRALSDIGVTRTWNLLIDVIAQSGRYPKTATSLDQFIVEGERRFWLHVAIDRYTGKVISQSLEPVYE